jgi:hypothetical protein
VAAADLGSLGGRAGVPVPFHWEMPNPAPQLAPWLVVLALLVLKPNRSAAAWLIWLALIAGLLITQIPLGAPSSAEFLQQAAEAMVFGLAAVWLVAPYLRCRHRVVTALCVLLALEAFGLLTIVIREFANFSNGQSAFDVLVPQAMVLGVGGLATALGLAVAGWLCRRGAQAVRIYLCLLVGLQGMWLLATLPIFVVGLVSSGGTAVWSEFFVPIVTVAGVNYALLLPFLILSSASVFYRERLNRLLHVAPPTPPMLITPDVPAVALKA